VLWLAAPAGALVGLSLGALGGGGSILTVPILVYLLRQNPHAATTGSLIVVGASALAGAVGHGRAGRVRFGPGLAFAAVGIPGAILGARLSAGINGHLLLAAFAAFILAAASAMLARRRGERARSAPEPARAARRRSPAMLVAAATAVGLLTGFFGVGGGFLVVPALTLVLGLTMPEAIGTSLLVIAISSAAALAARLGQHTAIAWPTLAIFTAAAILAASAGGPLVSGLRPERLTLAFAALLAAVALYTSAQSLTALL